MRENAEALNTQAIELASKGNFSDAIACFKSALIIDKDNYLLWYNLGVTYRDSGNLKQAKEALLVANRLNENDEDVLETIALIFYALNETQQAFEFCFRALEINNNNPHIWNNIGVLYFSQSNFSEAAEAFEQAVSIYPHYYDALFNLRDTYIELGNKVGENECNQRLKDLSSKGGIYNA